MSLCGEVSLKFDIAVAQTHRGIAVFKLWNKHPECPLSAEYSVAYADLIAPISKLCMQYGHCVGEQTFTFILLLQCDGVSFARHKAAVVITLGEFKVVYACSPCSTSDIWFLR